MSSSPLRCVADASVAIKLFVLEAGSETADRLVGQLATSPGAEIHVPDLLYIECANILWKYVRSTHYPLTSAMRDLADLRQLAFHATATSELMVEALQLAVTHGITAYDACYVALAQRKAIPLVTADEKLVRLLAGTSYSVQALGTFPISTPD